MLNIEEFAERLKTIMKYHTLNASSFADKIGVQRSAISHILTGRNKPSLDFVLKIIGEFKEVDLYWLLMGKGNFPPVRNETPQSKHNLTQLFDTIPPEAPVASKKTDTSKVTGKEQRHIDKIIILYKNGSFDSFEN